MSKELYPGKYDEIGGIGVYQWFQQEFYGPRYRCKCGGESTYSIHTPGKASYLCKSCAAEYFEMWGLMEVVGA